MVKMLAVIASPGLLSPSIIFRAGNRYKSVEDAATVRKMVYGYMERPRSIILAVVSAKNDFALQEVTEMTRELDPKGERTLGLTTKPEALDAGSDSGLFISIWHKIRTLCFDLAGTS